MTNNLLLETKFGSQVYGTALPTSDIDVGKVLLESREQVFGIQKDIIIAQKIKNGFDTREVYLRRFVKLCVDGNPNVIEWLFTPPEHIHFIDPGFKYYIFDRKHLFLQKEKLIAAHLGFAKDQIVKMRKHEEDMGAKRKALYAKFGYDVKYASHAARLIFQLEDLLLTGTITYPYQPKLIEILKSIKQGKWTLEDFDAAYSGWKNDIEILIQDTSSHKLPEKVDYIKISECLEFLYFEKFYPNGSQII